jgi:hypothetical protein
VQEWRVVEGLLLTHHVLETLRRHLLHVVHPDRALVALAQDVVVASHGVEVTHQVGVGPHILRSSHVVGASHYILACSLGHRITALWQHLVMLEGGSAWSS